MGCRTSPQRTLVCALHMSREHGERPGSLLVRTTLFQPRTTLCAGFCCSKPRVSDGAVKVSKWSKELAKWRSRTHLAVWASVGLIGKRVVTKRIHLLGRAGHWTKVLLILLSSRHAINIRARSFV